ncbi:MAG TPA: N-acetylmuramoyl-L-alanine amidase [Methylovirgula sp.]|nr:N-acetylmuramoyl-L-alanine amidase [Methylovirgula sp.]
MRPFAPDSPLAKIHPSPNFGARKGKGPDSIILHYTGMADGAAALARLSDPKAEVSAHYFIDETGDILQLVPEARRAWHAGQSCWAGESDMNSASIGIELQNGGHEFGAPAYPKAQIDAVIALCRDIACRHKIAPQRILAHSDIAPGRKIDPGEYFPWGTLAEAGIGLYVRPHPIENDPPLARGAKGGAVAAVQGMLAAYGYDVEPSGDYDERTEIVVAAFQRHFRPARIDGKADRSTIATLKALMAARP